MTIPIAYAVLSQDTIVLAHDIDTAINHAKELIDSVDNTVDTFIAVFDQSDLDYYCIHSKPASSSFVPTYSFNVRLQRVDCLNTRYSWYTYYIQLEPDAEYDPQSAIDTALAERAADYVVSNVNGRVLVILDLNL